MHSKTIQNRGLRRIHSIPTSRPKSHHIADLLHQTGWADLAMQRWSHTPILTYKTIAGYMLSIWWIWLYPPQHQLTEWIWETLLMFPGHSIGLEILAFSVAAPRLWSSLNPNLLNPATLHNFKTMYWCDTAKIDIYFRRWPGLSNALYYPLGVFDSFIFFFMDVNGKRTSGLI